MSRWRNGIRAARLAAGVAVGLAACLSGAAHGQCGPGAGPCDQAHPGPGCDGVACCTAVCEFDPACCELEWDESCVEVAAKFCADIPCPDEGDCFVAHEGSGCDDESCCFFVCTFDSFCCGATWDETCAEEALLLCGARPCTVEPPPGAVLEEELCAEHLNDGCSTAAFAFASIECGTVVDGTAGTGSPRDTDWYAVELDAPRRVTWTVEPEFPAQLLVVRGDCAGAVQVVAEAHAFGCAPASIDLCLDPGTWYLVVSTGVPSRNLNAGVPCPDDDPKTEPGFFGNRYVATLDCSPCGSPADLNGDGVVDGADLGILLADWGQPGAGDLDGNGVVDGADLGLLLAAWG